jgi:hypothetical protein
VLGLGFFRQYRILIDFGPISNPNSNSNPNSHSIPKPNPNPDPRASWGHGIALDISGKVTPKPAVIPAPVAAVKAVKSLNSREWRSARAAVVHVRLLQKQRYDCNPTLWLECSDLFTQAVKHYGGDRLEVS